MLFFEKPVRVLRLSRSVFEVYVQLRRTKQAKKAARRFHSQKRTHTMRVIIDAISTADIKTRRPLDQGFAVRLART
jgi:hypothetical protein